MAISIIRWILSAAAVIAAKIIVYLIGPVICLRPFIRLAEENAVTGYPSLYPGKPREFFIKPLMWAQTHDAPLDEYRIVESYHKEKWTDRFKNNHYFMRLCWLYRNTAYKFSHDIGFDQRGIVILKYRDDGLWRMPVNDVMYWIVKNKRGQIGWQLQTQWFYSRRRYCEIRIGWGVFRDSPDQRGMVYIRVLPFRKTMDA